MSASSHKLTKWVWTDADFSIMGWQDSRIHAVAFPADTSEFLLDLDYIFEWVDPPADANYSFWVSPATLVFRGVDKLDLAFAPWPEAEIIEISCDAVAEGDTLAAGSAKSKRRWNIECTGGSIEFISTGYEQFIRHEPRHIHAQALTLDERVGYSFLRGRDDQA